MINLCLQEGIRPHQEGCLQCACPTTIMEVSIRVLGKHLLSSSLVMNGRIKPLTVSVKLWRYLLSPTHKLSIEEPYIPKLDGTKPSLDM